MSNTEHPDGTGEVHRPFRCTFGPVREKDLVWPPPDEDVDAFTIVHLDDGDAPSSKRNGSPRPVKPTFGDCRAPGLAPRIRPLVVPSTPPALPPQPAESLASTKAAEHPPGIAMQEPPPVPAPIPALPIAAAPLSLDTGDPEITTAGRSAWLAVLFAAACGILAVFEYRIIVQEKAEAGLAMAEPPPMPQGVSPAELAPSVPRVAKSSAPSPQPAKAASVTQPPKTQAPRAVAPEPTRRAAPPATKPEPRPTPPSRLVAARAEVPAPRVVGAAPAPNRSPTRPAAEPPTTVLVSAPAPMSASAAAPMAASAPAPAPTSASVSASPVPTPVAERAIGTPPGRPSVVVSTAALDTDEVDIRSTLTRFRTAYSQLDARAARDVWPSVDARALERAFQSLKSQDLRFDRCNLTVDGARARASCTGRATYVPRIGDQSPRFTAREWAFELKKADEQWTIASARTL